MENGKLILSMKDEYGDWIGEIYQTKEGFVTSGAIGEGNHIKTVTELFEYLQDHGVMMENIFTEN